MRVLQRSKAVKQTKERTRQRQTEKRDAKKQAFEAARISGKLTRGGARFPTKTRPKIGKAVGEAKRLLEKVRRQAGKAWQDGGRMGT